MVVWLFAWTFFLPACVSSRPADDASITPIGEITIRSGNITAVSGKNMPVPVGAPAPPDLWKLEEIAEGELGYRLWHSNCTGTGRLLQCKGGLEVVHTTDPNQTVLDRYQTPQDATAVALAPPYVYVTWCAADPIDAVSDSGGGLKVLNHAANGKLVEVGSLETSCILGITLDEDRAFLATWQGLVVVDISQPAAPIQLGIFTDEGFPTQAAVVGQSAYVSWLAPCAISSYPPNCDRSLRLLDISNLESITESWSYDLDELFAGNPASRVPQMTVHKDYLYVPLGNNTWQLFPLSP